MIIYLFDIIEWVVGVRCNGNETSPGFIPNVVSKTVNRFLQHLKDGEKLGLMRPSKMPNMHGYIHSGNKNKLLTLPTLKIICCPKEVNRGS